MASRVSSDDLWQNFLTLRETLIGAFCDVLGVLRKISFPAPT